MYVLEPPQSVVFIGSHQASSGFLEFLFNSKFMETEICRESGGTGAYLGVKRMVYGILKFYLMKYI